VTLLPQPLKGTTFVHYFGGMKDILYRDKQYVKFCAYGFLKNLRFYEAFIVLFLLGKGMDFTEIGLLISIREISIILMEIPSGIVADAFGRRRTLAGSFVFYIASFAMYFVSDSFLLFAMAMLMFAVGDAFRTGVHKAMIFEYLKIKDWEKHKGAYYGHTRAWSQTGTAVSSVLAAIFVIVSGSYPAIFLLSIVPYFIGVFLIMSYPKALEGETNLAKHIPLKEKFTDVVMTFFNAFRNKDMMKGLMNTSIHSGYYTSIKDYLQPLLQSLAVALPIIFFQDEARQTALLIGIAYFVVYLSTAYMSRSAGKLGAYFDNLAKPLNLTLVLGFATGIISGVLVHYGFLALAALFFILILLNENLRMPLGIGYIADHSNQKVMAGVLSVESQAGSLFAGIIAPVAGFLADRYGIGLAISGITLVLLAISPFFWVKNKMA